MDNNGNSLSVVIPVYYDEQVLHELYKRLIPALEKITSIFEVILIDDGSKDNSFQIMKELKKKDDRLVIVKLARNFGQSNAISAGLDLSQYKYIAIMDSDLQDPPEFIEKLLDACIENDCEMAIAKRIQRKDSWLKKAVSNVFNKVSYHATSIKVTPGMGVFRILTKEAYDKIKHVPEVTGTTLSLLYWSGFDYVTVDLSRDARFAGTSGYTIRKMFSLALNRIFSYSLWPLRLATSFGLIVSLLSFVWGIMLVSQKLFMSITVPGWTTSIVLILLMFGINFIILGIIGEYIGRIYLETKNRPKYIIGKIVR
ncbi:MAG: glycosyltransferase family 2 protein [Salinivirgaceae bacterium]|nr:glycosyltransferase family 2 protein [Salinivirgaceae bacterium]